MSEPVILRVGAVVPAARCAALGPHEVLIDGKGRIETLRPLRHDQLSPSEAHLLLMPGFTNAHDHGRGLHTLACGIADAPLESWMIQLARQPKVEPYVTAALAFARMAQSGVAAVYHCHNTQDGRNLLAEAQAVSRAARDVGIRVGFGWPFFDANPAVYGSHDALADFFPPERRSAIANMAAGLRDCATNMALMEEARSLEHDLFTLHYHPVAPQWAKPETLAAIATASAQTGRRVHMHLLETRLQREWADAQFLQGIINWFDELGLLSPRLTVAHGVWLRDDELDLLARRGVTVSVNVSSNLRLRSGLPPFAQIIASGVGFGIGMDGMALDDDEDMLREVRLANLLMTQPQEGSEPMAAPCPGHALHAGWAGGRYGLLGEDGGGRIEVGAPADLVVLDMARIGHDLLPDAQDADLFLARATRRDVVQLYVGGREVVKDGRCVCVDVEALEAALLAEARAARLAKIPDEDAINTMEEAARSFYQAGLHKALPPS